MHSRGGELGFLPGGREEYLSIQTQQVFEFCEPDFFTPTSMDSFSFCVSAIPCCCFALQVLFLTHS